MAIRLQNRQHPPKQRLQKLPVRLHAKAVAAVPVPLPVKKKHNNPPRHIMADGLLVIPAFLFQGGNLVVLAQYNQNITKAYRCVWSRIKLHVFPGPFYANNDDIVILA